MRFLNLRLQHFRNIEFAELPLDAPRTFLLGSNGQGKSNLLEALSLATALRSFRTQTLTALSMKGGKHFDLVYEIDHEREGRSQLEIQCKSGARSVLLDGEKVSRLSDFIGRYPVVPLSSGDLMLLRGGPAERRRFLDVSLSVVDRDYYHALRHYHRGLAERNRLLKSGGSPGEFAAFEAEIAVHAYEIQRRRQSGMEEFAEVLTSVYTNIAEKDEGPMLRFKPNECIEDAESFCKELHANRQRDQVFGSTQKGPHRDDFKLTLSVGGAKEYASDGQQRGLCVALRIAQANFYRQHLSLAPVLLVDDVLGELDPHRRGGFWKACPADLQIIATGTELPEDPENWKVVFVEAGKVSVSC